MTPTHPLYWPLALGIIIGPCVLAFHFVIWLIVGALVLVASFAHLNHGYAEPVEREFSNPARQLGLRPSMI